MNFDHTTAGRTQGAHKEAGESVRIREANKRRHHARKGTSGYTSVALAHETHGRLGEEAKEQIRILADEAYVGLALRPSGQVVLRRFTFTSVRMILVSLPYSI